MERIAMQNLIKWKNTPNKKPLILKGARQVGKTWLIREFGKRYYEKTAYVNLENNTELQNVFTTNFDIDRILLAIQIATGITVESHNTLIVLDEIQEAERGLTSLKYFHENAPQYHIICAGSLLGVALNNHTSFPVGMVSFLDLYPLNFIEFLSAFEKKSLTGLLAKNDWELIDAFKDTFIQRLKEYYYVGGMPEAVQSFLKKADLKMVREIQQQILFAYEQDFSKHAPHEIVPRIRMLWRSMPAQLARENKKFLYGLIKEGARAREYELSLSWLIDCGLIHMVNRISKPSVPLKAYEKQAAFKLYTLDVGLLGAMTDLDAKTLLDGNEVFQEFKGALTEQYVLQQLINLGLSVYYWSADAGNAKIDFVVQYSGKIVPIEVKAAENLKAKSMNVYIDKFSPSIAIRSSMSSFREEAKFTNLPLYAISELPTLIEKP